MNEYLIKLLEEQLERLQKDKQRLGSLVFSPHIAHPEVYVPKYQEVCLEIIKCTSILKTLK